MTPLSYCLCRECVLARRNRWIAYNVSMAAAIMAWRIRAVIDAPAAAGPVLIVDSDSDVEMVVEITAVDD